MNPSNSIRVKVKAFNEIKLLGEMRSYDEIVKKIKLIFGNKIAGGYSLSYKDRDGTDITVSCPCDFETAKSEVSDKLLLSLQVASENKENSHIDGLSSMNLSHGEEERRSIMKGMPDIRTPGSLSRTSIRSQVKFKNYEDGKAYCFNPGQSMTISFEISNEGPDDLPEGTVMKSSAPNIIENFPLGILKAGHSATTKLQFNGPKIPGDYEVSMWPSLRDQSFGPAVTINIKVAGNSEIDSMKSAYIKSELRKLKEKKFARKYNLTATAVESAIKLTELFPHYDEEMIIDELKKAENDFVLAKTRLETYQLKTPTKDHAKISSF